MIVISLVMLFIVTAAILVVTYFAYPQRGRPVPRFPGLGPVLVRVADRLGITDEDADRRRRTSV